MLQREHRRNQNNAGAWQRTAEPTKALTHAPFGQIPPPLVRIARGATLDNEKLIVRFSNGTDSETLTLAHPGSGATGIVSLSRCGTVTVEVTADAGNDTSGIVSGFEFALDRAACSNCPTAMK